MIDRSALLGDLQKLLTRLEKDLLDRSESDEVPEVGRTLRAEYARAQTAERTAQNYEDWRSDAITQHAAAWVLSAVFVRFLEDNSLIDPPRISGPRERLQRARDEHELYFRQHPKETDRDFLLKIFDELAGLPGTRDVFGGHNPLRELPNWLSPDAAGELLKFFQKIDAGTGRLLHDFTDPDWDTRFLGDLYQDLSEAARKKYALLQTPEFVEEFILDRTLDPAIEEFGLGPATESSSSSSSGDEPSRFNAQRFRMIDPACGSGHFLLGAFRRIFDRWRRAEPGTNVRVLVQRALESVYGVDVNPYAIAIARFRLLLAALRECGVTRLSSAPAFQINLVCGDSLLHGIGEQQSFGWADVDHALYAEDIGELRRILVPAHYHAVVANPPYITPKDRLLSDAYRSRYRTCHRQYSLSVPFMERIFRLACVNGFTGQITSNSFMKREFGKKLVEEFLPSIDLTHVVDTSGAHIPGHGTPTVMIFGRHRRPAGSRVRAALGNQAETRRPSVPAEGAVWRSIVENLHTPSFDNAKVSIKDLPRVTLAKHPWSLSGGGAAELRSTLEAECDRRLGGLVFEIGYYLDAHEDEAFMHPQAFPRRRGIRQGFRPHARGEYIRDWKIVPEEAIVFPYNQDYSLWAEIPRDSRWAWFHALRTVLWNRAVFGGGTYRTAGRAWFEFHQFPRDRAATHKFLTYGFFATHNHFTINSPAIVCSRSAPVITFPKESPVQDFFSVLAVLNSSLFCFWSKQVFHDKGGGGIGGGLASEKWERFYEYTATGLAKFPICGELSRLSTAGEALHGRAELPPSEHAPAHRPDLSWDISAQEELDWECYRLYGLLDEDATFSDAPPLKLGQRAFEIVLARSVAAGETQTTWFERHDSTPITEIPSDWPDNYRKMVERRIELIESDPNIRLIEQPECKRRWNTESWESQLERALRERLLDRLESYFDFDGRMNDDGTPTAQVEIGLISIARLADLARNDPQFQEVGALYRDDNAFDVQKLVEELVLAESVPLLPVLRYKDSGLRKRAEWEKTWELQRREDAGEKVGTISVPPKYTSADFLKSDYWRLRGKLDVPKERWVSFPHCDGPDGTPMIAWGGYDHLQLARAVSEYFVEVQEKFGGRDDSRLPPLLAGLTELVPWLKQWHNAPDPAYNGQQMGDYFEGFIQDEARQMGKTLAEVKAWTPPAKTGRGRKKKGAE